MISMQRHNNKYIDSDSGRFRANSITYLFCFFNRPKNTIRVTKGWWINLGPTLQCPNIYFEDDFHQLERNMAENTSLHYRNTRNFVLAAISFKSAFGCWHMSETPPLETPVWPSVHVLSHTFSLCSWVVVVVDCLHVAGQARSNGKVRRSCWLFSRRASSTNQSLLSLSLEWPRHLYLPVKQPLLLLFSVTRRSRSDSGHSLTDLLMVSRLDWCDPGEWWRWWKSSIDESCLFMKVVYWWKLFIDERCLLMKVDYWWKLSTD